MAQVILKNVTKRFGQVVAVDRVNLDIADEEFVVLVGPSGCGKSTTLRMIAGLEDISEGELYIGERLVNNVHPKDRDIAMVFQNYALYPHMSVRDNMAFGLKLRGLPRADIDQRVNEAARILDIAHLLERKPKALSGGQRQRVAMGRAIVRDPQVFLFDEPLSNLDARLRVQMRVEISELHRRLRRTIVYVTHDQVEAMTLADRIVVMNAGLLQQVGTPMDVFHRPVNLFVAGFIGSPSMNFMPCRVEAGRLKGEAFDAPVPESMAPFVRELTGDVTLGVRPQALRPAAAGEPALLKGEVSFIEHMGNEKFCHTRVGQADCVARVPGDMPVRAGDHLDLAADPDALYLFDAAGRNVRFARKADGTLDNEIPTASRDAAVRQGAETGEPPKKRLRPAAVVGLAAALAVLVVLFVMMFGGSQAPPPAPQKPAEPVAAKAAGEQPAQPAAPATAPKPAEPAAAPEAPKPATPPGAPMVIEDAPEPITITLWHAYRGSEIRALLQVVDGFNASHKNLQIRALPVPYDALNDKLLVTLPQGRGPDIFVFAHNMLGSWVEHESGSLVEPITNLVDRDDLKRFIPLSVQALVFRKALYGLPFNYKSLVLFYNKAMVATPPQDTATLVAEAKKQTNPDTKTYGLVYEAGKLYFHVPWIHGYGGISLGEDNQPHFDTEAVANAAVFARSLVQEHKVLPVGMDSYMVTELFNTGKAAMVLNGPWFRAEIKDVDYGVAPMPKVSETGQVAKPFLGVEAVFLSSRSPHKDWAFKIMQFLTSEDAAKVRAVVGKQPVANVAVYDDPEVQKDPYMKVFQHQAEDAVIMPSSRQMQAIWGVADMALNRSLFTEEADARQEMIDAHKKMVSDVARVSTR